MAWESGPRRRHRLPSFAAFLLLATAAGHPQNVTTKISVYNEIFMTDSGLIPLPDNAIELDPGVAAVHYNRGIALAHRKEFAKAIEDFETAAKLDPVFAAKAKEQIDYCRARLKSC